MSCIIIFDFEVFAHDTLLGTIIIENDKQTLWQSWNLDEIRQFYMIHKDDIWVGYNNLKYDNLILEGIISGKNEDQIKDLNEKIIRMGIRPYCKLHLYSYDVMQAYQGCISLKTTEAATGKSIEETHVDFNLSRKLTEEEKQLTEFYNKCDLEQTLTNFNDTYYTFELRLNMMKLFNLPISCLNITGTQIAARCLQSKRIPGIDKMTVPTILPKNLELKNEELKSYYLNEKFRTTEKLSINIGNTTVQCGAGGAHSAIKQYHTEHFLYFDVSGYYNLIMILYDLLPRTMPPKSKELYKSMYEEQLTLKKKDPNKRRVYKTILLSVFGSMMNEYTDFYDPWHGSLVTITGQLFIVDLLEKLEDLVIIIQTNTDGIMVEPKDWNDKDKIINIVKQWMERTGFVIKIEEKYNLWQRDVNCYICQDDQGNVEKKGNRFYEYFIGTAAKASLPYIICRGIEHYFVNHTLPHDTVYNNLEHLEWYQYICKKQSYDYVTYDIYDDSNTLVSSDRVQSVNRAFPNKYHELRGVLIKHKSTKSSRIPNIPDNVFLCDKSIEENKQNILDMIDLEYYVKEIYTYIREFVNIKQIKEIHNEKL